jgi:hypothetical protein
MARSALKTPLFTLTKTTSLIRPIEEFEYKLRRIINDYIRPPKNEFKLNRALWWMDRFSGIQRAD